MKYKIMKFFGTLFLIITMIAFIFSLCLILYYFDIIPNKNLGFLDISHLIAGFVAGAGTLTGLLGFLFLKFSKQNKH